jgi:DNA-binding CsgD family transcriptional regulator
LFDLGLTHLAFGARIRRLRHGSRAREELRLALRDLREAAAALFLSPKTIEYHLRSVYGKLGSTPEASSPS